MANTEGEAPYIRVRLPPEQKQRWREYAEEHHHGTISGLVREAVENTIDDEWVLQSESSRDIDLDELGLDELKGEIETVNSKIDELIVHGLGVEDDQLSQDELVELSAKCEDRLPEVRGEEHLRTILELVRDHQIPIDMDKYGTVDEISNYFKRDQHEVWQALEYLESVGSARVQSVVIESIRHWYIQNPDVEMREEVEEYLTHE
jgi:predicted DNA-binding protein